MKLEPLTEQKFRQALEKLRGYPSVNGVTLVDADFVRAVAELIEYVLQRE